MRIASVPAIVVSFHHTGMSGREPELGLIVRAVVAKVVDGDTIDVWLMGGPMARIRLIDCWAPEVHGEQAKEGGAAKKFLEELLPPNTRVKLRVLTGEAGSLAALFTFGRLLGEIWLDGQNVSELLIAAGHATKKKERFRK